MVAAEEIVLTFGRDGADFILGKVVVELQTPVLKYTHHVFPSGIGIGDGLPREGALAVMESFGLHPSLHFLHDWFGPLLPLGFSVFTAHGDCIAFMLYMVEFAHFAEEP